MAQGTMNIPGWVERVSFLPEKGQAARNHRSQLTVACAKSAIGTESPQKLSP